jgi:AcrR family transcriptional regulator
MRSDGATMTKAKKAVDSPRRRGRPKSENRRQNVMEAAAHHFCANGYDAASMRDIADAAGLLVGSLYHHFSSKEDLFINVFEEGLRRTSVGVLAAIKTPREPWAQLEAACIAHVEVILSNDNFVRIADYEFPFQHSETVRGRIIPKRDAYEAIFNKLIKALPLRRGVDRKYLRLTLFGAMGWTLIWYRPGRDTPTIIAKRIVDIIRKGAEAH